VSTAEPSLPTGERRTRERCGATVSSRLVRARVPLGDERRVSRRKGAANGGDGAADVRHAFFGSFRVTYMTRSRDYYADYVVYCSYKVLIQAWRQFDGEETALSSVRSSTVSTRDGYTLRCVQMAGVVRGATHTGTETRSTPSNETRREYVIRNPAYPS